VWLIYNEKNEPIGYASNSKDISQTKLFANELQNKQARLSAIINNTEDDIVSIDRDFNIIEFNDSIAQKVKRGYGYDLKPGKSIFLILPPGAEDKLRVIYAKVLNGERIFNTEEYKLTTGATLYHETTFNPIFSNDKILGISIFSRDITERKNKERELEIALKEKELLLAEIHHRVKNNLAIISGFLQLEEFNAPNEEVKEILRESKARIKTTALVHELLYKNESLSKISIATFLSDLLQLIKVSFEPQNSNISIVTDIYETNLDLEQAIPLGLILNELVVNSYKHAFKTKRIGEIFIGLRGDEKNLMLIISDNGDGFPPGFDFFKSTNTGCVLVKTFVEQLNGNFEINTEKGTKYLMTFELEKNSNS
jgi:PAS domain S-box-containing protein